MRGFLLADKEAGLTSFKFMERVRRELGADKAGHAGTLDLFASGLMVILLGQYTRLAPLFDGLDKEYEALVALGSETDTLDPGGEVVFRAELPDPAALRSVIPSFVGAISQRPPTYSAVHLAGERAYRKALRGEEVEMPARAVRIDAIEVLALDPAEARLRVRCSKGTYIRSLARDIALAAGSRGHLKELRRTAVGPFRVDAAWKLGEGPLSSRGPRELDEALLAELGCGALRADAAVARRVLGGMELRAEHFGVPRVDAGPHCVLGPGGEVLALVEGAGGGIRYLRVIGAAP